MIFIRCFRLYLGKCPNCHAWNTIKARMKKGQTSCLKKTTPY
ncbi:hypothetical protein [Pseudomonas syringae group genomosp. 3]